MKIMLLGSEGQVGTAIRLVCKNRGIECLAFSHDVIDICDKSALAYYMDKEKPEIVINAAAMVGINPCEKNPLKAFDVNTVAVHNIAINCEERSITLVHFSTHSIFDGTKDGYYTENDCPNPINTYGVTKLASESIVKRCPKYYIFRFPTLFGSKRYRKSFPDNLFDILYSGGEISVSNDKVDSLTYSMDAVNCFMDIINNKPYGIYHIANYGFCTYYEFFTHFASIANINNEKIIPKKEKTFEILAPNALRTAMASSKIEPLRHWKDALADYLGN